MGGRAAAGERVAGGEAARDGGVRAEEAELRGRRLLRGRQLVQHEVPGDWLGIFQMTLLVFEMKCIVTQYLLIDQVIG